MDDSQKPSQDKTLMDIAALESFAKDLLEDRYKGKMPTNWEQEKTLLLKEINEAINTHFVTQLSEQDQIALDELLDKNPSDEDLNKFFTEKIPNLEVEIASALLNFRAAYLLPLPAPIDLKEEVRKATETMVNDIGVPPPPPPAPVKH